MIQPTAEDPLSVEPLREAQSAYLRLTSGRWCLIVRFSSLMFGRHEYLGEMSWEWPKLIILSLVALVWARLFQGLRAFYLPFFPPLFQSESNFILAAPKWPSQNIARPENLKASQGIRIEPTERCHRCWMDCSLNSDMIESCFQLWLFH